MIQTNIQEVCNCWRQLSICARLCWILQWSSGSNGTTNFWDYLKIELYRSSNACWRRFCFLSTSTVSTLQRLRQFILQMRLTHYAVIICSSMYVCMYVKSQKPFSFRGLRPESRTKCPGQIKMPRDKMPQVKMPPTVDLFLFSSNVVSVCCLAV